MKDIEGHRISTNLLRAMLPKWQVVPIMNTALNIQTIIEVDRRAGLQIQEETNLVNLNISRNQPKRVWWVFWSFWSFLFQGTAHPILTPVSCEEGESAGCAEANKNLRNPRSHWDFFNEILRLKLPCPRCRKCTDSPVGWTDLQGYTCQDRTSDVGSEKLRLRQPESVFFLNGIILWHSMVYTFLTCPYDAKRNIYILPVIWMWSPAWRWCEGLPNDYMSTVPCRWCITMDKSI